MAKKIFKYRGRTLEELRQMPMDELVTILPSRIRRKIKRGFDERQKKLLLAVKKAQKQLAEGGEAKPIKTHCRDVPILPDMVGLRLMVYNGKEFIIVEIQEEMIGTYLGEYAHTRKQVKHSSPGVGATRSSLFVPIK
ncbi:MAG: 30S ribosomal protein S19 [Candidatus Altiarchaeota archaeon]